MKRVLKKLMAIIDGIYGWGILVCLFVGGLSVLGFLAAFIIGGEAAEAICVWLQKKLFGVLIYGGNIIVLLGLVNMYLKRQKSLTMNDQNRESN